MTTTITGHRVFTCNTCGATFRFTEVATYNPDGWPTVTYGTVVDEVEDTAMRRHATTHGGFLDRQLAYCGPTTYTTHTEQLTAEPSDAH